MIKNTMKLICALGILPALCAGGAAQQVGASVSANGGMPNSNAMLDVQSPPSGDGKGILIPRLTEMQRTGSDALFPGGLLNSQGHLRGGPAQGLLVYQIDGNQGFYYNTSTSAAPVWAFMGGGTGDFKADGSVPMAGDFNAGGHAITNAVYYGDGSGLHNLPSDAITLSGHSATELDDISSAGSGAIITTDERARINSNQTAIADEQSARQAADAGLSNRVTAIQADTLYISNNYLKSDGSVAMTGNLNLQGHMITNVAQIAMGANVAIGDGASSYSSSEGSVAIGKGSAARYRVSGVAIGMDADGDYNGIGIGYQADGQYSNIAIGYQASSYSGYDRITIGRSITNRRNDSVAMRGTLYLDGGTGVLYRSSVGVGDWSVKAFTIDHPLDPENMVLRHYCVESPRVWNMYAGNAQLMNGRARVVLPEYYSALNEVGSEVYNLTALGGRAMVWIERMVSDNEFVIGSDADITVSWTIKVLRNDPACRADLMRLPVEQRKSNLRPDERFFKHRKIILES